MVPGICVVLFAAYMLLGVDCDHGNVGVAAILTLVVAVVVEAIIAGREHSTLGGVVGTAVATGVLVAIAVVAIGYFAIGRCMS